MALIAYEDHDLFSDTAPAWCATALDHPGTAEPGVDGNSIDRTASATALDQPGTAEPGVDGNSIDRTASGKAVPREFVLRALL